LPNRPGYLNLAVNVGGVQQVILDSPEFQKFSDGIRDLTSEWFDTHRHTLAGINSDTRPNTLISIISDDLLTRFKAVPLLDEYDVYEQLMSYWHSSLHDDVFLIMNDGWVAAAKPRPAIEDKDRKVSEIPDLEVGVGRNKAKYKMDLVPPALVVARYFADDQERVNELDADAEAETQAVGEYVEEHAVEEGLLAQAMDDDKLSKALATARLKAAERGPNPDPDEIKALQHVIILYESESEAKKAAKEAQTKLGTASLNKYGDLIEADIETLVLDDKWLATIGTRVVGVVNALTLDLVARIQELGERYGETVGDLDAEVKQLEAKVVGHLADMGIKP
jgi:type I restriction enzyme M protein